MTPADLRAWRLARGLTLPEAAQLLDVSHRWYAYAEAGRTSHGKAMETVPRRIQRAVQRTETPDMDDDYKPGDRVWWNNDPTLCGTVMRPPPDRRLHTDGWVWVLWDDNDMEHCDATRLICRE